MGVIKRQGFKFSIVSFVGAAIGAVSTIFIYPKALEMVGLYRSLYDAAVLATILVLLGSPTSAVRFFSKYKDDSSGNKGFLTWLLIVAGAGFIIYLIFFPLINQLMSRYLFDDENKLYEDFILYLVPLTFFIALTNLLARYISNFRRIVIPSIFENITIKITLPLILLMYLGGWIHAEGVVIGIVASFGLSAIGMLIYLMSLGQWKLGKPEILKDPEQIKEYSKFSGYSILTGIGSQVAFRIDGLMVATMIQFEATGLYSVSMAISEVISRPMRALTSISGPMIAQYLANGNMTEVKSIYRKSSLNMTIIGLGLFLLIWTLLPYIFDIMPNPEKMHQGTYVVFFLGLTQVWDMMTGVNNEIIIYSKYYRFNLYLTLFLAVANIIANFILIPHYGITGSAMATCLSFFLFNVVKYIFIYIKFGFQPLSLKLIPVMAFGVAAWLICTWMPNLKSPLLTLIYKGALFCLLYGIPVWKFQISEDINQWIAMALGRVNNYLSPKS